MTIFASKVVVKNSMHIGMALMETFTIWFASSKKIKKLVKKTINWDLIEQQKSKGRGIIFLTPHMGSFEITAQYYGINHPIKVMFKPSKREWINNCTLVYSFLYGESSVKISTQTDSY